jgi:large subunit ribosomal protein L24
MAHKIKKGDTVAMRAGKDTGKVAKVVQVFPATGRVVVDGLNTFTKHLRSRKQNEKGQKLTISAPVPISRVILICSKCSKPARIGYKILENKKKVRICHKCHEVID